MIGCVARGGVQIPPIVEGEEPQDDEVGVEAAKSGVED